MTPDGPRPPVLARLFVLRGARQRSLRSPGYPSCPRAARYAEGGFLTIWLLGVCLLLLALGGVSVDLWHVFAQRQALAGVTDAAAVAGASGIDPNQARLGTIVLDAPVAKSLAQASLDGQPDTGGLVVSSESIALSPDGSEITVSADGQTSLGLLSLLTGQRTIAFHVSSTASAERSP